jgi:hypothetical protein
MRREAAVLVAALAAGACARAHAATEDALAPGTLRVPARATAIGIDGELDELSWTKAARTGAFRDAAGAPAAPYSDARFLHDRDTLYVGLYAADENVASDRDAFDVKLGAASLVFGPRGVRGAGASSVRAAVDSDGTIDDPRDDDEEWVVEAAIPLASIGDPSQSDAIDVAISRCDTPKSGDTGCGAWRGRLVLR